MQAQPTLAQEEPGQIGQDGYMALSDDVSHLIFCATYYPCNVVVLVYPTKCLVLNSHI
jgi:hypothetical protein